jgi:hypothetical protein
MPEEIVLRVAYTEQDFVDAAEGYRAPRRLPMLLVWIFVSGLLLLGYRLGVCPIDVFVAGAVGLGFYLFVFQPLITNILTRRDFRNSFDARDEVQLAFSDSGVVTASASTAGKNYWRVFTRAVQTDEGILLFYEENSYLIIPRRFYADSATEEGLKRLLFAKVPNFKVRKDFGPSLGRVAHPVRALIISIAVLVLGSLLVALLLNAMANHRAS